MNKNLRQVLYDMKHQPVIGIVTMIGTALAIFLIMVVVMMNRVTVAPFAPETNRDRTLYGKFINIKNDAIGDNSSAGMTEKLTRRLYDNLDGAECMSVFNRRDQRDVMIQGKPASLRYINMTDHNFWRIYDFDFIEGKPFDENDFESSAKVAVICRSLAESLFGSDEAVGQTILVEQKPFRVIGVVKDVSPLSSEAYAEVFTTYRAFGQEDLNWSSDYFGPFYCVILAESPETFDRIRADVQSRKQAFDSELGADGFCLVDHGSPFTQSEVYTVRGSNGGPDSSGETLRMIIYIILLIVPAINLSSMTQSRLYRRISEIGVKRAFGSTRGGIVGGIITENFIVTLAGGLLGLLFCFMFGFFFSDMLFTSTGITRDMDVPLQLLLDWKLYGTALLFCFILNLLSSGIPAWRASRVDPVKALSGRA